MRYMKKCLAAICVAAVVAFALVGCNAANSQSAQGGATKSASRAPVVTEGLKKQGTLTVGLRTSSTAPFITESNNGATGMDVDLAGALADALGLDLAFERVDNVSDALTSTCDVVLNVSTEEAKGFDVVGDYAEAALSLFHKGEPVVVSVDDVKGKKVALQEGSSAQRALRLTTLEVTEVPCSTLNEAFDALDAGDCDYVLCSATSGGYLASRRDGDSFAGAFSTPKVQGIAVASGDGALQTAVRTAYEEISGNGILAEIRRAWMGSLPTLTAESVIANIPVAETEGEALESLGAESEVLSQAMDGSTAGSNAVSMSEAEAMGAAAPKTTTTVDEGYTTTQNYTTPTYVDYSDYSDYSNYSTPTTTTTGYSDYSDTSGTANSSADTDYSGATDYSDAPATTDYAPSGDYTETYGY